MKDTWLLWRLLAFPAISLLLMQSACLFFPGGMERPESLSEPRVLVGESLFKKRVFYENSALGVITDIRLGELDPAPGEELGIVGSSGAVFLGENMESKATVDLRGGYHECTSLIDVEGDGATEFLYRGSWLSPVILYSHSGRRVWSHTGESGVDDAAAGDLDGDGIAEVVVGFNGGGGVHLLNAKGQKLWGVPDGNVWHVEIVDTDGDGKNEIVHSNAAGKVTVRDSEGNVIRQGRPPLYFADFSLTEWFSQHERPFPLYACRKLLRIVDYSGKPLAALKAPLCQNRGASTHGTLVNFGGKLGTLFAAVVDYSLWDRALLYIYDSEANLLYQEVISGRAPSIAAIPARDGEGEVLLIGGVGKVWEYAPKA